MKQMLKQCGRIAAGGGVLGLASNAMATGTDYSSITGAVDWSTVGAGVIAIAVLAVGVYATVKGAKILVRAVRGA